MASPFKLAYTQNVYNEQFFHQYTQGIMLNKISLSCHLQHSNSHKEINDLYDNYGVRSYMHIIIQQSHSSSLLVNVSE